MAIDRRGVNQLFGQWLNGRIWNEDEHVTTGNVFWVDSNNASATDAAGYGWNPGAPFATIDYAVGQCTNNNYDIIYVMPEHAETIAAAAGIVFDVIGVRVIGLGEGTNRPHITFDGGGVDTAVDIDFDANDVIVENIRFTNTEDGALAPLDINAAYCQVNRCKFTDAGTDNTIDWILLDANADYFECHDCWNEGTATAGNDSFLSTPDSNGLTITGLRSHGDFAAANIEMTAAAVRWLIEDCVLENANAVDVNIEGFANATGMIVECSCKIATDGQVTWTNTLGESSVFRTYGVNDDGETGIITAAASV